MLEESVHEPDRDDGTTMFRLSTEQLNSVSYSLESRFPFACGILRYLSLSFCN